MPAADVDVDQVRERQAAVRALLRQPVLTPADARFPLVRRHRDWLREWFTAETGWVLTVDAEVARLHKHPPATVDASRPATDRHGTPFIRRRYVLTCLALAVIERAETQLTLGWLADQLLAEAADGDLGVDFDLRPRDQRSDLVAVVRLLLDTHVIAKVAGDEQASIDAAGDALYDVNRRVLGRLLAAHRGPSTITASGDADRVAALVDRPVVDAPEARARAARTELGRRLLDDPVVYLDDLDDREVDYLRTQRAATVRRLAEGSGLGAEVRAEGIAMLDPTGDATDVGLPEDGTDGHVTLLVAEHLAGRDSDDADAAPVPVTDVEDHVRGLIATHGDRWRKSAREEGAERGLTATALTRLSELGLVALETAPDGPLVLVRPAVHRFAADDPTVAGRPRRPVQEPLA